MSDQNLAGRMRPLATRYVQLYHEDQTGDETLLYWTGGMAVFGIEAWSQAVDREFARWREAERARQEATMARQGFPIDPRTLAGRGWDRRPS